MARRRTGVIFKRRTSYLGRVALLLRLIGKPFFWSLAVVIIAFFWLSILIGKSSRQFFSLLQASLVKTFKSFSRFFKKLKLLRPPRIPKIKFRLPRPRLLTFIFVFLSLLLAISHALYTIFKGLPSPNQLLTRDQIVTTKIYDRNGLLLYKIYRQQNRTLVKLKDIPLSLVQATIAIEDAEFYNHHGFSFKGMLRAIQANLAKGKFEGGSTITQQLVKNALLSPERTWERKIKEIILALAVEQKFTKDEILQMYLNEVGYGGATYGVEEAAQTYFGKSVGQLSLAESALLAGLPASPTTFSPFGANPELSKQRQELVLRRMKQEGFITTEEEEKAKKEKLIFAPQRTDIRAPHFVMFVKDYLVKKYGERMVEEGGLEVTTTLDLPFQEKVQQIVKNEVDSLKRLQISNGAALATNPKSGEILAMVGSKDYFDTSIDGNVNVTLRSRQPGSAIKPVNYSLALENGFTAASVLSDTPITYRVPGQPPYSPRNYDGRFHGNIPLRIALGSSYNVPAVKVLAALGVQKMVKRGQEMGITSWEDPSRYGLSLTLGGGEVKMIDLAVVYGTLANLGKRVDLNPIILVKDYKGKTLEKFEIPASPAGGRNSKFEIIRPGVAFILTNILSDNAARTPAFGPNSQLVIPNHPHVAVKTGTTQNLRDNWTIGYTPDYLVATWVGNNDNTPMSYVASGVTGASPIWHKIMAFLLKDIPDKEFSPPDDVRKVEICPATNTLPCQGCGGKWEHFLRGTEPKHRCNPEQFPPST